VNRGFAAGIFILAYCLWNGFSSLVTGWQTAPLEQFSWLPFLLWLLPIFFFRFWQYSYPLNAPLLFLGLLFSLIGSLGALNTFKYIGLAMACAGFLPWKNSLLIWLASALVWMPAFGWWASRYLLHGLFFLRLAVVLFTTLWTIFILRKTHDS
jgi:hypothetical protein